MIRPRNTSSRVSDGAPYRPPVCLSPPRVSSSVSGGESEANPVRDNFQEPSGKSVAYALLRALYSPDAPTSASDALNVIMEEVTEENCKPCAHCHRCMDCGRMWAGGKTT